MDWDAPEYFHQCFILCDQEKTCGFNCKDRKLSKTWPPAQLSWGKTSSASALSLGSVSDELMWLPAVSSQRRSSVDSFMDLSFQPVILVSVYLILSHQWGFILSHLKFNPLIILVNTLSGTIKRNLNEFELKLQSGHTAANKNKMWQPWTCGIYPQQVSDSLYQLW